MTETDLITHYGITAAELQAGRLVDPAKVSESRRTVKETVSPEHQAELARYYTHIAHVACGDGSRSRFDALTVSERRLVALRMASAS